MPTERHSANQTAGRARRGSAAAAGLALMLVALAGCTGLPSFSLPGPSNGGLGAENGQSEPGLLSGNTVPQAPPLPTGAPTPPPAPATTPPSAAPGLGGTEVTVAPPGLGWLVQFEAGTSPGDMQSRVQGKGGTFVFALQSLPIAYVLASDAQAKDIAHVAVRVEREAPLQFHDAESRAALRVNQATDPVTGLKDAAGNPIDGRGVGIAVVDTGIDALHPDLPYGPTVPGGVVAANYKVESQQYLALPDTDTTAGHGTHVAAIVAGQGIGDLSVKGVAPGARLYGLGIGEAATTVWSAQAFDWVLQHADTVQPRIRIVTNSWGTTGAYDPASTTSQFVNALVAHGITVVFSAGNGGGDGTAATTSPECRNPTPGVICVAAFDDLGTGTRDGHVAAYSSRGATAQASTWPDISAPGTAVLSARPPAGSVTGFGTDVDYVELSGTSQAAPHVTGILALMLQKHPTVTPATLESVLKSTAYKFTDGGAYAAAGGHYAKGYGLADAYNAVSHI
ncbi:MAG: S8 family serine peptidase [Thermoplasmatota archaeon]